MQAEKNYLAQYLTRAIQAANVMGSGELKQVKSTKDLVLHKQYFFQSS